MVNIISQKIPPNTVGNNHSYSRYSNPTRPLNRLGKQFDRVIAADYPEDILTAVENSDKTLKELDEIKTYRQFSKRSIRLLTKHAPVYYRKGQGTRNYLIKRTRKRKWSAIELFSTISSLCSNVLDVCWADNKALGRMSERGETAIKRALAFLESEGSISRLLVNDGVDTMRLLKTNVDKRTPGKKVKVQLKDLPLYGRQFTPYWGYLALTMAFRCIASPSMWGSSYLGGAMGLYVEEAPNGLLEGCKEQLRTLFPHIGIEIAYKRVDEQTLTRIWVTDGKGNTLCVAKEFDSKFVDLNGILRAAGLCWLEVDVEKGTLVEHLEKPHKWEIDPESDAKRKKSTRILNVSDVTGSSDLPSETLHFEEAEPEPDRDLHNKIRSTSTSSTPCPLKRDSEISSSRAVAAEAGAAEQASPQALLEEAVIEEQLSPEGPGTAAGRAKPKRLPVVGTHGLLAGMRKQESIIGLEEAHIVGTGERMLPLFPGTAKRYKDPRPVCVYVFDEDRNLEAVYKRDEGTIPGKNAAPEEKEHQGYVPGYAPTGADVTLALQDDSIYDWIARAKGLNSRFSGGILQDPLAHRFSALFPSLVWSRKIVYDWFRLRKNGVFDEDTLDFLEWTLKGIPLKVLTPDAPFIGLFGYLRRLEPEQVEAWWVLHRTHLSANNVDTAKFAEEWLQKKIKDSKPRSLLKTAA
ncbi:hypothetical protein FEM03_06145 [Phragmitibacter flavus]|uniref:Uncharacterized protein n=1 Tax=Phragmitibacter flavus TaxID=2576071 RepID=A0A5R8KHH5_9BACT|nr:hypothetical protein [Phragmitibacter flavus]TLD71717.1 hypothetical protein FEM03_06145 [Phragmitibacter flavus]